MDEKIIHMPGQKPPQPEPKQAPEITGDTLQERVISALRGVYDPELPVNVYDLGLIYGIDYPEDGCVHIRMTLTTPACPVAGTLPGLVEAAVRRLDEIHRVSVELVWDPPWSQEQMSDEARLEMGLL